MSPAHREVSGATAPAAALARRSRCRCGRSSHSSARWRGS